MTARGLLLLPLALAACAGGETLNGNAADAGKGFGFDAGADDACTGEGCGKSPCLTAAESHSSVGCEYWAVDMDGEYGASNGCFVAFVANTADAPAHLDVSFAEESIDVAKYAKIPRGKGRAITYEDFDASKGLPPGEVAIVFLAGLPEAATPEPGAWKKSVPCPVAPAKSTLAQRHGTGIGQGFHVRTDVPVVAYQMLPYGGGSAAVTGATLLLPTSAWDTNYVAVNAYATNKDSYSATTSMDIVAAEDGTVVTLLPKVDVVAGGGLPGGKAGTPLEFKLDKGQVLQLTQPQELTGSPVQANKPIGLYAGQPCLNVPIGMNYCDHAEQQIPPIRALGSEYVAVSHRPRTSRPENPPFRLIGAVDGTTLTWDPAGTGPSTLAAGEVLELTTGGRPFVVKSQDAEHPFVLTTYMTGSSTIETPATQGYGDADFLRLVPVPQYLDKYVFFTDPTYPETNLVLTRKAKADGSFADVDLDCLGVVKTWVPVGSGSLYQYAYVDLSRHDFQPQNGCDNGRHVMKSASPFGLSVWGWGTTETKTFTRDVSYAYPAGENLAPLNTVVVPARPK